MYTLKSKLPFLALLLSLTVLAIASCTDNSDSGASTAPVEQTDTLPMDTATTRPPVKTTN